MDIREYKERAKQAALRAGPGILRVFAVYVGVLAVLNVLIYFLETPFYDWSMSVRQFVAAGDFDVPLPSNRVRYGIWFSLLLTLLGQVVSAGWVGIALHAARGGEYSWHDLWNAFPWFWKVFVIAAVRAVVCPLAACLFIFPGIYLFYGWRLAYLVLAEHPDYGPIRCLRQSRRLMVGERMNLFRLDLSCFLLYGLALLLSYFSSGIISAWRMPTLAFLNVVFYNRVSFWRDPEQEAQAGEGPREGGG